MTSTGITHSDQHVARKGLPSTQHDTVSKQMGCQAATDLSHADKLRNPYSSKSMNENRGHSLKRRPRNYRTLFYLLCTSSNR
jgi:hypothetical protein